MSCGIPEGCVEEGNTVTVTCTRSQDLTEQSRIRVNTADGSATGQQTNQNFVCIFTFYRVFVAPPDYCELDLEEMKPTFFPGNVLNFRGGTRRIAEISFQVEVLEDGEADEPPEVFFIDVTPVRTVIILTPEIPVIICGSMHANCYVLLAIQNLSSLQLGVIHWMVL